MTAASASPAVPAICCSSMENGPPSAPRAMTSAPAGPEVDASGEARTCSRPSVAACRRTSSGKSGQVPASPVIITPLAHRPAGSREVEGGEGPGAFVVLIDRVGAGSDRRGRSGRVFNAGLVGGQQAHARVARLEESGDGGGRLVERLGQRGPPREDLRHALQGVQFLFPAAERLLGGAPLPRLQLEARVCLVELSHAFFDELVHVRAVELQFRLDSQ